MIVHSRVIFLSLFAAAWAAADYIAAVVEHSTYQGTDSESSNQKLGKNLEIYDNLIQLATEKSAQVVVFPEFGLTPSGASSGAQRSDLYPYMERVPEPSVEFQVVPCNNDTYKDRPILTAMSCSSQQNKQLVLVNMIDYVPCDEAIDRNCPDDGQYIYNTDALFDEGTLVAKYHKSHEWPGLKKEGYDQPDTPSQVTYTSKFGVEFGLFICFDIMFPDPAKALRSNGVEHFLYAVKQGEIGERTIIEGWSRNNNASLLSSNLGSGPRSSDLEEGDCSGIIVNGETLAAEKYYLNGPLGAIFPYENILVATVPC